MKELTNRKNIIAVFAMSAAFLSLTLPSHAQQFSAWSAPQNLGANVNTTAFEGCPFVTEDGLDLFFISNRASGLAGAADIYVSHRDAPDAPWGFPVSLGMNINRPDSDETCPALYGRHLYFASNRPGGCGSYDLYRAERLNPNNFTDWGAPVNLGCQLNSPAVDAGASFYEDEDGVLHLYFHSNRTGGLGLADIYTSQRGAGAQFVPAVSVAELNTSSLDIRAKVRSDGLEIFFESNRFGSIRGSQDIYTATRASTSSPWSMPVNLGFVVNTSLIEGGPAISFDGTELYFMSNRFFGTIGDQDVYVSKREPVHSVAFQSNRDGNNEIYVMNSDGSEQIRRTNHPGSDQRPDISPYGNFVAFASNRVTETNPEGDFEIFLMNEDGSDVRQLTFNNAVDTWARFSPDGKLIAFHSNVSGNFEIYIIRINGTDLTRLTDYPGLDQFPEWSPDSEQLAIRRDNDLYLIDSDDANAVPVRLTASAGINQMASWSPDGKKIAFMSTRDGYPSVFLMNADGSGQINLIPKPNSVPTSAWSSRAPAWSKNGQLIYFTALRPETGANENIWVMNPDGMNVARLTFANGMSAEAAVR
jgi:Tol biopolymer transport system component